MPNQKLTKDQRALLIKSIRAGADEKLLVQLYGITRAYIRKLAATNREIILDSKAEEAKDHVILMLRNPTAYKIGTYKNGSPILAYIGEKIAPVVIFHNPQKVVIGIDQNGKPIEAWIGQGPKKALEIAEAETGATLQLKPAKIETPDSIKQDNLDDLFSE